MILILHSSFFLFFFFTHTHSTLLFFSIFITQSLVRTHTHTKKIKVQRKKEKNKNKKYCSFKKSITVSILFLSLFQHFYPSFIHLTYSLIHSFYFQISNFLVFFRYTTQHIFYFSFLIIEHTQFPILKKELHQLFSLHIHHA